MIRKRELSFAYAYEHLQCGMRDAFPSLREVPEAMQALLAKLDPKPRAEITLLERLEALRSLFADERRDAEASHIVR